MDREKRKDTKKTKIKYIIIAVLVIIIIGGFAYVGTKLYSDYKEKQEYDTLAEFMQEENLQEQIEENNEEKEKTDRMLKLEELHAQNEDILAWIEIPDTNINYPVLQTDNNSYYENHNYKKEYAERGSIFFNKNVNLEAPSSNFLMYGHRNKNGAMFEDVFKYSKKEFYENHKTIRLTTLNEDAEYEVMSAFYSRVYYQKETNVFRYYRFINMETEEQYNEYVSNAKKASIYDTGVEAKYGEHLITLSTCEYSQENGRFVVVAKKIVS